MEIGEYERDYFLKIALPGVKEEDIKLTVEGRVLTIEGEGRFEKQGNGRDDRRLECRYGIVLRSFTVPEGPDRSRLCAQFFDGRLRVRVPKSNQAWHNSLEGRAA